MSPNAATATCVLHHHNNMFDLKCNVTKEIQEAIIAHCCHRTPNEGDVVEFTYFTEYVRQGTIFCAHPQYHPLVINVEHDQSHQWYDWAMIRWQLPKQRHQPQSQSQSQWK